MATSTNANGARSGAAGRDRDDGKTPAQWYCYLGGAALLLAGILGFIVDAGFNTGDQIEGGQLFGLFEVNGWHNVVHIASGLVLLAAAPKRVSAKAVALAFGIVYGAVAIWGLIDGDTVLGLIPVNAADNVLHIALSLVGILAALASDSGARTDRSDESRRDHIEPDSQRTERFERGDVDSLTGRPRQETSGERLTR